MEKFHDNEYLNLIGRVFDDGVQKGDRTGTGTISTFAQQLRFDLSGGSIPLLTSKKMHTKSIIHELLWFLDGDTNIKYLNDNGVRIWNEWADEDGELGPIYGAQWRHWGGHASLFTGKNMDGIDQIAQVINQLRNNPNDRRIIVSAWNVGDLELMALPPCHAFFQFWSRELSANERELLMDENANSTTYDTSMDEEAKHKKCDTFNVPRRALSCHLYQRSCDVGLGVPFNIAQYSILVHMFAQVTGHVAEEFIWTGGDTHIYNNHIEQLKGQLALEPYNSPTLKLNTDVKDIDDFTYEDFEIVGYVSHPTIKMPVAV